jgi:hypothetical protein
VWLQLELQWEFEGPTFHPYRHPYPSAVAVGVVAVAAAPPAVVVARPVAAAVSPAVVAAAQLAVAVAQPVGAAAVAGSRSPVDYLRSSYW